MVKKEKFLHEAPPTGFNPKVSASLVFIESNNKLLLLLTSPNKNQGLTWSAPGGKLDPGETPLQAAVREVQEETGIVLQPDALVDCGKFFARNAWADFILHIYKTKILGPLPSVQLRPQEHTEFRWLTFAEIAQLPLMQGADECLERAYGIPLKA